VRRLVFLCLSAGAAIVPALGQEGRFRSSAELVTIDVLVTDDRRPIADLAIADFELLDNGVRQSPQLLYLERLPVVVMMVLDGSGSVEGERLASLKRAAAMVVDRLRPVDRAAIVTFSHRLGLRAPLTSDRAALHASIAALTADGSTSLRDAAFAGLTLAAVDRARTLMMLFSDGVDTSSLLSDRQVVEIARRSDVTVYPIGIRNPPRLTGIGQTTGELSTDDRFLRDLAQTTGGRLVYAEEHRDLSRTFTRVIDEFNSRYVLGYAPAGVPGRGWHRVEVRLKNRKGTVVSRRGYFAY
jgi:VWFA-related protein